jgi:hypothetical protein
MARVAPRTADGPNEANRKAATSLLSNSGVAGSCDEFPFAAAYQGCLMIPRWCKVDRIKLSHNSLAGTMLNVFMQYNRLIDNDKYWVKAVKWRA